MRRKGSPGLLYVISTPAWPGYVKIGTTTNIKNRMYCFQAHCPERSFRVEVLVEVPNQDEAESKVHRALAAHRSLNTEWFRVEASTAIAVINSCITGDSP